jgi:flagellar biogenesis protein FliO
MSSQSKKNTLEILTIFVYASLLAFISYFHEPWFDEAQAWLIARDSSLFDMIWNVLRYEGHPPIWYLSLFIPAHLGIPFEIGLKSVNFIFAVLAAGIFIRYSTFPLLVRLLTPFTYFLFYQYGVISRSYSLFMLVLWLIAAAFPKRNERPFLFAILLSLLGGVTAYGMLIAFGIALAWLLEIITEHRKQVPSISKAIKETASDSRFHSLIFTGMIHIFYLAMLWPMPDRHTPQHFDPLTIGDVIFRFFSVPVGSIFWGDSPETSAFNNVNIYTVFIGIVGLFLVAIFFIWAFRKRYPYYVLLPYIVLTLFMSFVYFSPQHSGIYIVFILFAVWIVMNKPANANPPNQNKKLFKMFDYAGKCKFPLKKIFIVCLAFFFLIQIYWSFTASINDIRLPYAPYRELASYLKENEIEGKKIFNYYSIINHKNAYFTSDMAVLSYFSKNIFYNHNPGKQHISYAEHRKLNDRHLFEQLNNSEQPDFLIGHNKTLPFYDKLFSLSEYVPVQSFMGYYMWKDIFQPGSTVLYIREDLLQEFPEIQVGTQ